jgi:hypothetical protein
MATNQQPPQKSRAVKIRPMAATTWNVRTANKSAVASGKINKNARNKNPRSRLNEWNGAANPAPFSCVNRNMDRRRPTGRH